MQTSQLNPKQLLKTAERARLPWGAWRERVKGKWLLFVCVGGQVSPQGALGTRSPLEEVKAEICAGCELMISELGGRQHIQRALPCELNALRFDAERAPLPHSDRLLSAWVAWGERGWSWRPALTFAFQLSPTPDPEASLSTPRSWVTVCWGVNTIWGDRGSDAHTDSSSLLEILLTHSLASTDIASPVPRRIADPLSLTPLEGREAWLSRVQEAVRRCKEGELKKVVLARSAELEAPQGEQWSALESFEACFEVAERSLTLEEERLSATPYALSLTPERQEALVGLTPERLIRVEAGVLTTHALAGTRARPTTTDSPTPLESVAHELFTSEKDQHEHALVVEELSERLRGACEVLSVGQTRIKTLNTLLHLETPLEGRLNPHINPLSLLDQLHPTPALGGSPRAEAMAHLRDNEPLERGGYAAPWAWRSAQGDLGAYVVIRSALLRGSQALLFAGAGVVEGSQPELEWRETHDKLTAALTYLRSRPFSQAQLNLNASLDLLCALLQGAEGVAGVVISPGSRSTPLALAAEALAPHALIIDERMAGFYALGWARTARRPVALICTSGSAGAHYLPALIEARAAGVPLIALTADRPEWLQGLGAPQTVNQRGLFGAHVCWQSSLDTPLTSNDLRAWHETGERARVEASAHPQGPVHLNLCFDEPLWSPELEPQLALLRDLHAPIRALPSLPPPPLERLKRAKRVEECERGELPERLLRAPQGLIYCGPLSARVAEKVAQPLARLAHLLGWPVWLEAASQLRAHPALSEVSVCWGERGARLGALPSSEELEGLLLVGAAPHSRATGAWLAAWGAAEHARESTTPSRWVRSLTHARCVLMGERPEPANPLRLPACWCTSPPDELLSAWVSALEGRLKNHGVGRRDAEESEQRRRWRDRWRALDALCAPSARPQRSSTSSTSPLWGGTVGEALSNALSLRAQAPLKLPPAHVHVASSMAFRDLDMTLAPSAVCELHTQRGANGIDGALAACLGSTRATPLDAPLVLWVGDTAAHHDLSSLARWAVEPTLAQRRAPTCVLLVNNGGGGIFGLLPIKGSASFQELFFTPTPHHAHAPSWGQLARCFGLGYEQITSNDTLYAKLHTLLCAPPSPEHQGQPPLLLEVLVDPECDLEARRAFWGAPLSSSSTPQTAQGGQR